MLLRTSNHYRLVYASRGAIAHGHGVLEAELRRILESSRRGNPLVQVTGALLFNIDAFAQVLEGHYEAVNTLFEKIAKDKRHRNSVILEAVPVERRAFAHWSMGYGGRHENERVRFASLVGDGGPNDGRAGAGRVLNLLGGAMSRNAPVPV